VFVDCRCLTGDWFVPADEEVIAGAAGGMSSSFKAGNRVCAATEDQPLPFCLDHIVAGTTADDVVVRGPNDANRAKTAAPKIVVPE
jgi:hypothetical protein